MAMESSHLYEARRRLDTQKRLDIRFSIAVGRNHSEWTQDVVAGWLVLLRLHR
jgi:hypothetical protein